MVTAQSQAKNWTITLNNYTDADACLQYDTEQMSYLICGKEVGENGTPHLQGYVQLKKRLRFTQVSDMFPGAHLEVARGRPKQNQEYCSKDGNFHEHGVLKGGSGTRNDLNDIKKLIDEGCTRNDIREQHYSAYMRYNRQINQDIEDCRADRDFATEVFILWGATGVGKSRWCAQSYPEAFWKTRGPWWDGYEGQETVVVDEFYGWIPFDFLLRLCDRYPMRVEVKGGTRKFVSRRIVFTSNKSPEEWYEGIEERYLAAFRRRINGVCELGAGESVNFT